MTELAAGDGRRGKLPGTGFRLLIAAAAASGIVLGTAIGLGALELSRGPAGVTAMILDPTPSAGPATTSEPSRASMSPAPTPSPTPEPTPEPTPTPTPALTAAPLTGVRVTHAVAARHPIAVMIDDHGAARPQSGLSEASIVWHAPAEAGIPRYMAIFQETLPTSVGPIRSAREYFIAWAAEWRSLYVHVGGSPQALATLRSKGDGQLVYGANELHWAGRYIFRTSTRFSPHNTYSDGTHLRELAGVLGATDGPIESAWQFVPDAPLRDRPTGGSIEVSHEYNQIRYDYDRASNAYPRTVTGEPNGQVDAGTSDRVAPKNVVVMFMRFDPLNDGHPEKQRLEAGVVGTGPAWIATGGRTVLGTWRKDSLTDPTRFFGPDGDPARLTIGQTFIQVLPTDAPVTVEAGREPTRPELGLTF
jgi:hypothetical protein